MKTIQINNIGNQPRMVCSDGYPLIDHDLIRVDFLDDGKPTGIAYIGVTTDRRGWSTVSSEGIANDCRDFEFLLGII